MGSLGKVLVSVGATLLVVGVLLGLVASSKIAAYEKEAQTAAVLDDYLPGADVLGVDEGAPSPERLAAQEAVETWQGRRNAGRAGAGLGVLLVGAGVVALRRESQSRWSGEYTPRSERDLPGRTTPPADNGTSERAAGARASLRQLDALRDDGTITAAEHAQRRARIIDQI